MWAFIAAIGLPLCGRTKKQQQHQRSQIHGQSPCEKLGGLNSPPGGRGQLWIISVLNSLCTIPFAYFSVCMDAEQNKKGDNDDCHAHAKRATELVI